MVPKLGLKQWANSQGHHFTLNQSEGGNTSFLNSFFKIILESTEVLGLQHKFKVSL